MTRSWGFCFFLITILVALVASTDPDKNKVKVLRELKVINASNANVKQCLWFAMQEYNKESEDKYIFQVIKTVQAQLQVTDRLEYFIDVEIARSNCRKLSNGTENCVIQENTKLEKVFGITLKNSNAGKFFLFLALITVLSVFISYFKYYIKC